MQGCNNIVNDLLEQLCIKSDNINTVALWIQQGSYKLFKTCCLLVDNLTSSVKTTG